ncbi:MAG: HEPN domain-containing protein [Candidatus Nanohalobium sp.]
MSEVDSELELAEEALNDLDLIEAASIRRRYSTLYYALYHSARAVLISMDYAPKNHQGLDSLVHNILYRQEDLLTEDEASFYSKLKTRREQADYEKGFLGSEEEYEEMKSKAREIADKLKESV